MRKNGRRPEVGAACRLPLKSWFDKPQNHTPIVPCGSASRASSRKHRLEIAIMSLFLKFLFPVKDPEEPSVILVPMENVKGWVDTALARKYVRPLATCYDILRRIVAYLLALQTTAMQLGALVAKFQCVGCFF